MSYEDSIEWAKREIKRLEQNKQQVILNLADKLEQNGMTAETISQYISEELSKDGYVSEAYIRRVLPEKYKNKAKQRAQLVAQTVTNTGETVSQPEPIRETIKEPEPEPAPPIQSVQQPSKPIPDYRFVKYGNVSEAFEQIKFALGQVMDKQRQCKMGLLIYYT